MSKNKFNFKKCFNLFRSSCYKLHDYPDTHVPDLREDRKRCPDKSQSIRGICQKSNRSFEKGEVYTTVNSAGSIVLPSFVVFSKQYSIREIHLQKGRSPSSNLLLLFKGYKENVKRYHVLWRRWVMKFLLPTVTTISSICCLAHNVLCKIMKVWFIFKIQESNRNPGFLH